MIVQLKCVLEFLLFNCKPVSVNRLFYSVKLLSACNKLRKTSTEKGNIR